MLDNLNARKLQNIQHFIGSFNQVLPIIIGIYIGRNNLYMVPILFLLLWIFTRISSEITFRILQTTQSESLKQSLTILYKKLKEEDDIRKY